MKDYQCQVCFQRFEGESNKVHLRACGVDLPCCDRCASILHDTLDVMAIPERRNSDDRRQNERRAH